MISGEVELKRIIGVHESASEEKNVDGFIGG